MKYTVIVERFEAEPLRLQTDTNVVSALGEIASDTMFIAFTAAAFGEEVQPSILAIPTKTISLIEQYENE